MNESILDSFRYDPENGTFRWRRVGQHSRGIKLGGLAGSLTKRGYIKLSYKGKLYSAHRVAWFAYYGEWPDADIDHVNGDKADNRIANLRLATDSQNMANSVMQKNNKVGFKGVSMCGTRYKAQISKNGEVIYLGLFGSAEEAHAAYCEAAKRLHGEFFRAA